MKLFLVVAALVASLSLCNLSDRLGNRNEPNANNSNQTANSNGDNTNAIANAPSPETNANDTGARDTATTLRELLDIEKEWTEANIRADRDALERILADEYLGTDQAGTVKNKQEYIATIQPSDAIQSWDFSDLNVTQSGSNVVLTGIMIINIRQGRQRTRQSYRFTDSFVRRDGRWQAVSSQVTQIRTTAPPNNRRRGGSGVGSGNDNTI